MKVGIIGSGGREHAICETVKKSNKIDKIFCFPGNAGTKDIAENINIDLDNFEVLKNYILEKKNWSSSSWSRKTFSRWIGWLSWTIQN